MKISIDGELLWESIVLYGESLSKENRARTVITFNSESPAFGKTSFYLSTYSKIDKYGEEHPNKKRWVIGADYVLESYEIDEIITRWSEYIRGDGSGI